MKDLMIEIGLVVYASEAIPPVTSDKEWCWRPLKA
jgi:hypothetical protein